MGLKRRYSFSSVEVSEKKLETLRESLKPIKKPISWVEWLNANPVIRNFLSELVLIIYDEIFTNSELERLREEGEELEITSRKLQKKRQNKEDRLKKSPQFLEEINKLQLGLKQKVVN